jgi:hypothetical protein
VSTLQLTAPALTAEAVDVEARTAEGILVPWNEPGRTNLGAGVRVRRGAVRFPADGQVFGIVGHDRERPVSTLIAHEDRPEGLWGRLRIARTPRGDELLAELTEGIRSRLSVEMSDLIMDGDEITAGLMDFVAHVPKGAFDSARVHALAAAVNTTANGDPVTQPDPAPVVDQAPAPAVEPAPVLTAAAVPGGLSTAAVPTAQATQTGGLQRLATLQAALATGNRSPELRAALADITNTGLDLFQAPAGIGTELWSGGGYTRRFVPLMTNKTLTSWKFNGWRWTRGPEVDDYVGDKQEIPTNPVSVEPVSGEAQRVAGGWDIDRKFRDFGDSDFWAGFYAAQAESYAEKTDEIAAAAMVAAARSITVNANVPGGYVGSNVAQGDILRAVAYGQAVLEDTPNVRRSADFVLMNPGDWLGLMDLTNLDLPAFLSLLGVQPGAFLRHPLVPAGAVILGCTPAISFYELGGGAPIRVEALDIARAGIDSAVYGYVGTLVNRPGGIISVPLAADVTP